MTNPRDSEEKLERPPVENTVEPSGASVVKPPPLPAAMATHMRGRRRRFFENRVLLWLASPLIALISIYASGADPLLAVIFSAATFAMYWMAFSRLAPGAVILQIIVLILATYYILPMGAVLWMAAAAVGGGTGAWLAARGGLEDDLFFAPPAAALAAFALLVWLGLGFTVDPAVEYGTDLVARIVTQSETQMQAMLESGDNNRAAALMKELGPDRLEEVRSMFAPALVYAMLAIWVLALWVAGRIARALQGRLRGHQFALILFKIRVRYTIVLIAGLLLAILEGFFAVGWIGHIGYAVLLMFAMACFFEGLGLILFFGALWRLDPRRRPVFWMMLVLMGVLLAVHPAMLVGPLIILGAGDIWFDLRKIYHLRRHLDGA